MSANGEQVLYGDISGSGDDDLDDDGVGLVLKDESHSGGGGTRKRKYVVSEDGSFSRSLPSWCQPRRLSKKERICVVAGTIALVILVVIFVTVPLVARSHSSSSESGSDDEGGGSASGDGAGGGGGSDHGGGDHGGGGGEDEVPWSNVRLQSAVTPMSYDISLALDMDSFLVTGSVNITCLVTSDVKYIAVHVKDMTIPQDGHRLLREGKEMEHNHILYEENDFFIFNLTRALEPGQIEIALDFKYTLREDLAGFYRSSYTDGNGDVQYLATTQFEPTDARRAFPCFDEPAFKANFTLHMTHQSHYRAWFNMPQVSRTGGDSDGTVTTHFQTSVRMSTYLVAFVVSDFECVNDTIVSISDRDVLVSHWLPISQCYCRIMMQSLNCLNLNTPFLYN